MKPFRWLFLFTLASPLMSQNVRWDLPIYTVQASGGNLLPVYAVPGAAVSFYSCTNATPPVCTTLATTYISAASSTTCPTTAQITLNGTSTCVATADPYGNMGAWFQPGDYMATITAQGSIYNYYFTVGGGGSIVIPGLPQSNAPVYISASAGGSGYSGNPTCTVSGGTCATTPVLQCTGEFGTVLYDLTNQGSCSVAPTVSISGIGTGASVTLAVNDVNVQATIGGTLSVNNQNGAGTNVMASGAQMSNTQLTNLMIMPGASGYPVERVTCAGGTQPGQPLFAYYTGDFVTTPGCSQYDLVSFRPSNRNYDSVSFGLKNPLGSFSTGIQTISDTSQPGIDFNPEFTNGYALPQPAGFNFYLGNTGGQLVLGTATAGTGYTGTGICTVTGGTKISGTADTCTAVLNGSGGLTFTVSGTGVYSVAPTLVPSGFSSGSGAIGYAYINNPNSISNSLWVDPAGLLHWSTKGMGTYGFDKFTVDSSGNVVFAGTCTGCGGASGVSTFSAGTTGLTPSTATSGPVTLAGTLAIANGGTGATSGPAALTSLGAAPAFTPQSAGLASQVYCGGTSDGNALQTALNGAGIVNVSGATCKIVPISITGDTTDGAHITFTANNYYTVGDTTMVLGVAGGVLNAPITSAQTTGSVAIMTATNSLTAGMTGVFWGLTGASAITALNGTQYTVISSGLSTSQFEVTYTGAAAGPTAQSGATFGINMQTFQITSANSTSFQVAYSSPSGGPYTEIATAQAHLVIRPSTTLHVAQGTSVTYNVGGLPDVILENTQGQTSNTTPFGLYASSGVADAATTGTSTTITSASICPFTSANQYNSITCSNGAGGSSFNFSSSIAQFLNSCNIVVDDPVPASTSSTQCYMWARDNNIVVDGGNWSVTGTLTSAQSYQMTRFKTIRDSTIENATFTETGNTGVGKVMVQDFQNVTLMNLQCFTSNGNLLQDCYDTSGPGKSFTLRDSFCQSGDDCGAATNGYSCCTPFFDTSTSGTLSNIVIDNLHGCSYQNTAGYDLHPSESGRPGNIQDVRINHLWGDPCGAPTAGSQGFGTLIKMGGAGEAATNIIQNVDVNNSGGWIKNATAVEINAYDANTINIGELTLMNPTACSPTGITQPPSSIINTSGTGTITGLKYSTNNSATQCNLYSNTSTGTVSGTQAVVNTTGGVLTNQGSSVLAQGGSIYGSEVAQQAPQPTLSLSTSSCASSTLSNSTTYYYCADAVYPPGTATYHTACDGTLGNEQSITTAGSGTNCVYLTIGNVAGAEGYSWYRGTSSSGEVGACNSTAAGISQTTTGSSYVKDNGPCQNSSAAPTTNTTQAQIVTSPQAPTLATAISNSNTPTGLSLVTPTGVTTKIRGHCEVTWEQNTAVSTVKFLIVASVSPTAMYASINGQTTTLGVTGDITSTAVTQLMAFTAPAAANTFYTSDINFTIIPSAATTISIYAISGSSPDTITIGDPSGCSWY